VSPSDADEIRDRARSALAKNRVPGYNFAGLFLGLECRRYDTGGVLFDLPAGPHCADEQGIMAPAAVLFFADMVLAAAIRAYVDPNRRTATLMLRLDFTGAPARGALTAEGHSDGFRAHTALPEAMAAGTVTAGGVEVVRMSGNWAAPPTPEGRTLAPLPWESREPPQYPGLSPAEFDPEEKGVMRRVEQALKAAGPEGFLPHLWRPAVRAVPGGAASRIPLGMYMGNRVGHVQGGLTMHVALATAVAAVPQHPLLVGASAWYISPGQGKALTTRSTILQNGRNIAVVRTEVFAPGRKLVLEVISNHAVPARGETTDERR
jgi:acyl-coenzyme A thioesterase PaaI-like protein